MAENFLRRSYMAKPSDCNAEQSLPLPLLVGQMIEIATDHANLIGIGFLDLEPRGLGWVLSRLSVEMIRWPKNGEEYVLTTWIESYNSFFSERCFSVVSRDGEILGYGRTVWVIIDLSTHKSMGTAHTEVGAELMAGFECPMQKCGKHRHFIPDDIKQYTFQYTDIDFYRHVNTVKYIALLLNQFTLDDFDSKKLTRFDIAFSHEAKYGETVTINSKEEEVKTPTLLPQTWKSTKRLFDLTVGENTILNASIVLSEPD